MESPPSPATGDVGLPLAARRHALVARVERRLRARCEVGAEGPATVVIGVSGGADSTALLLAMATIASREATPSMPGIVPVVAHVHHHLRDAADDDATWVETLCAKLGVECHVLHVNPADVSGNCAANARALRYESLLDAARAMGAHHVAVAHHADDQLETILMALGRGAGLDGLAGMPWRRAMDRGVTLVRPLLDTRRAECEELCRAAELSWREDPGNLDPSSTRARVRQEIAPVMEALWPDAARRVTNLGELVDTAALLLRQHLEVVFGSARERRWVRHELQGVAAPLLGAGLRRAALDEMPHAADELGQKHLLAAADAILDDERRPRSFDWPCGLRLEIDAHKILLKRQGHCEAPSRSKEQPS